MSTIFEKIIDRTIKADIVYETEEIIAFRDIAPQAPVHILICPKKPIPTIQQLEKKDLSLVSKMMDVAQILAKQEGIDEGYRLVINNGKQATQLVFHLHMHLLGGKDLSGKLG